MGIFYGMVRPNGLDFEMDALKSGVITLPHDKESYVSLEEVGFGLLHRYKTPECPSSRSPRNVAENQLLFCADGRLDYREDLCALLHLSPSLPDEELMLAAYMRWGKAVVQFLEGDWLLCAYDKQKRELFIARDKHGYTSLYFTYNTDRFSFCSTPRGLLALPDFKAAVNRDAFVAKLLLLRIPEANAHFLENILILHPAHTLTYKDGECRTERYWFPENIQEDPDIGIKEASEKLRHLLIEAVRVRLRTYRPICSTLSGGLDSGAVATLVAAQLKERLSTFSHVPLYPVQNEGRALQDETAHILATANRSGNISPTLLRSEWISPLEGVKRNLLHLGQVNHASGNAFWMEDIIHHATQGGFGTVFTGEMGNATISFAGVASLSPYVANSFVQKMKYKIRDEIWRKLPFYGNWHKAYVNQSYLREELVQEYREIIKGQGDVHSPVYENAASAKLALLQVGANPRCTLGGLKGVTYGLSYRDPCGDVRVIEHCLRLSNDLYFDAKGNNKQVIRHALKDILPDSVLYSPKKGVQSADLYDRLLSSAHEVDELLGHLRASALTQMWMDVPKLDRGWRNLKKFAGSVNLGVFFKNLSFAYYLWGQENNLV